MIGVFLIIMYFKITSSFTSALCCVSRQIVPVFHQEVVTGLELSYSSGMIFVGGGGKGFQALFARSEHEQTCKTDFGGI
jgi:hypothetical protein